MTDPRTLSSPAAPAQSAWRLWRGWLLGAGIVLASAVLLPLVVFRTPPVDVRVERAERGLVEESVTSSKAGAIRSRQSSQVSVDVAGTITKIHARQGVRVKAGDHLLSIDRREAEVSIAAARGDLTVFAAQVGEARARRESAGRERDRLRRLAESGTLSQIELDRAQTELDAAGAAEQAALARVEAQKAVVQKAEVLVEKCDIHAPFDGIVAELYVEVGEWALPGKQAMKILDPDRLYVRAELDEVDMANVRVGLPARVTLDPYRDRKLVGKVVRVAPYVSESQEQNRTLEIEVDLDRVPEGMGLKPGTSADVEVILRDMKGALRVPSRALLEGNRVLVAGVDGVARAVALKLGIKNWEYAQVLEGLSGGEPVIVSLESEKAKDGARIRVIP